MCIWATAPTPDKPRIALLPKFQLQAYADEGLENKQRCYVLYFARWKGDSNLYMTMMYHMVRRIICDESRPRARKLYVQVGANFKHMGANWHLPPPLNVYTRIKKCLKMKSLSNYKEFKD